MYITSVVSFFSQKIQTLVNEVSGQEQSQEVFDTVPLLILTFNIIELIYLRVQHLITQHSDVCTAKNNMNRSSNRNDISNTRKKIF